ncbi:MAG: ABC transporter substrate-binding protein [Actinomycetota bacterium]|nr:ABC transporter substrate-binding protein [Actinomycetota bacterium]
MQGSPIVRRGATLVAASLVAAACAATPEPAATTTTLGTTTTTTTTAPPTTTTEPRVGNPYGGVAIVADDQEPPTLNPYAPMGDNFIVSIIGQAYFTGVYEIDGRTLELIPEVVTELPTMGNGGVVVNENGTMTVSYTIRDEAVWEDGVPISGDDFAFTLEMIQDPDTNAGFRIDDVYGWIESFESGPKSFSMTLNQPTVLHEQLFRVLIPKHAVEGSDFLADWNDNMWPSGGPFRFTAWEKGSHITVERNDNYWKKDHETGQPLPYLDAVEFRFIPETEAIVEAFTMREVDVIQPPPNLETIDQLVALEPEGARVEIPTGPVWEHLNFQFGPGRLEMNEGTLNHNLDYRKAVAHLIDREAVAAAVSKYTKPLSSYVDAFSPSLSGHAWNRYPYDPEKARELLEKVKVDEGVDTITATFTTTSTGDTHIRVAEALRPMFEAVGVELELKLQDSQYFLGQTLENGTWDLGLWPWVGSPGLAGLIAIHDIFDPDAPPPDGSNYYRWGTEDSSVIDGYTERFAEVRDLMNETVDGEELTALIAEAEEILADQMVILPLYSRLIVGAVWEDEIGGFVMNHTQAFHTWNIEEWYRADL